MGARLLLLASHRALQGPAQQLLPPLCHGLQLQLGLLSQQAYASQLPGSGLVGQHKTFTSSASSLYNGRFGREGTPSSYYATPRAPTNYGIR
jgi:hypothetical protein